MEVYFGWWGLVNTFYGWVGVGGGLFWVDGGVWTYLWVSGIGRGEWSYILGGWGWVDIFYGWVGLGGVGWG